MQGDAVRLRQVEPLLRLPVTARRLHGCTLRLSACQSICHTVKHIQQVLERLLVEQLCVNLDPGVLKKVTHIPVKWHKAYEVKLLNSTEIFLKCIDSLTRINAAFYNSTSVLLESWQWRMGQETEERDLWQNSKWVQFRTHILYRGRNTVLLCLTACCCILAIFSPLEAKIVFCIWKTLSVEQHIKDWNHANTFF